MASMFDNYENLCNEYIPTTIKPISDETCDKLKPCNRKLPFEEYNVEGELIGYWWYYKDTLNLEFNIEGEVIIDQGEEFDPIYETAEDFLQDKEVKVQIYNFRNELIDTKVFEGSTKVIYPIDEKLSEKLVKGVYYCSLTIYKGSGLIKTLLGHNDCIFTVR